MRRFILALTATSLVVAASYGGRTQPLPDATPAATSAVTAAVPVPKAMPTPTADVAPALASTRADSVPTELDRLIRVFERRTSGSVDAVDFRTLGSHYTSRAGITGDVGDYLAAVDAYRAAYRLAPADRDVILGLASASSAVHDFATSLELALALLEVDATDSDALAIATDATLELGNVATSAEYLDRLEAAAPNHPAVLARLATLAHTDGRQEDAIGFAAAAHQTAIEQGVTGRSLAFFPLLHSDLLLDAGRYEEARSAVDAALEIDASYATGHAGLGRVLAHQGDHETALASYLHALGLQDDPGWSTAAGELLVALGRDMEAASYFTAAVDALADADEVIFGQALSNLYADLDIEAAEALRLAKADLERRSSIHAYDTLAWAQYRNGNLAEARAASDVATATGAMDAALLYHSALIAAAMGDTGRADAELNQLLSMNPGFNPVQSEEARRLLANLNR